MASSSSSSPDKITLDVFYQGTFSWNNDCYENGVKHTYEDLELGKFSLKQLLDFIKLRISDYINDVYLYEPQKDIVLTDGLKIMMLDDDVKLAVEIAKKNGNRVAIYVDHTYEDDQMYYRQQYSSDSDDSSVASLDHLSEGEEELRQVRMRKRRLNFDNDEATSNVDKERNVRKRIIEPEVVEEKTGDPTFSSLSNIEQTENEGVYVEPEHNSEDEMPTVEESDEEGAEFERLDKEYTVHNPNTHWKLKRPILGERYANAYELKDCLIFYSVVNGYQLWYDRSDSKKMVVRCGFSEKRRKKDKGPIDPRQVRCPFYLRGVKMTNENSWC